VATTAAGLEEERRALVYRRKQGRRRATAAALASRLAGQPAPRAALAERFRPLADLVERTPTGADHDPMPEVGELPARPHLAARLAAATEDPFDA
jgi:broad specificity phosphatase PhoE